MTTRPSYEELERRVEQLERRLSATGAVDAHRLQELLACSPHAVYLVDGTGKIVLVNRRGAERLGRTDEELIGTALASYFPPEVAEERRRRGIQVLLTGEEVTCEDQIGDRWYLSTISLLRDMRGQPAHLAVYGVDITARRRAELELQRSEATYRTLFEEASDGIVLVDREPRTIIDCNRAAQRLFGREREALVGLELTALHPPEGAVALARLLDLPGPGMESRISTRDGVERQVAVKASRVMIGARELLQVLYSDITEAKRHDEQIRQAQKLEAIGTLAGGIAHDFNNLLMGIQGNVSLLQLDLEPALHERIRSIEACVQSGTKLTAQLLGFARGGRYEVRPTELNRLVERVSAMFGRTRHEITIRHRLHPQLWVVEVDGGQLEQVLLNLLVNAWHAMSGGGELDIQTDNLALDEDYVRAYEVPPGRYVRLSVTDNGVGMDAATRARIFEPFFTTREMGRGTGLGLATVYGIVRNHGGFISVYSEKGKGSTFNVHLPASDSTAQTERPRPAGLARGTETVLLVDDEETTLGVASRMLERLGYEVLTARGGAEALELYSQQHDRIALVLLDMIMPGMGGSEVFDRMRQIDPHVRVLLSSGYSLNGSAQAIVEAGCRGFIQKPYNLAQLSCKVREALEGAPEGRPIGPDG